MPPSSLSWRLLRSPEIPGLPLRKNRWPLVQAVLETSCGLSRASVPLPGLNSFVDIRAIKNSVDMIEQALSVEATVVVTISLLYGTCTIDYMVPIFDAGRETLIDKAAYLVGWCGVGVDDPRQEVPTVLPDVKGGQNSVAKSFCHCFWNLGLS